MDFGAADSHRIVARFTHSDAQDTADVLVRTLQALVRDTEDAEKPHPVELPSAEGFELETAMRPRDEFFARVEQVPLDKAVGRVAAEMVSPYPPGVPVIPDAADPELSSLRVVAD